MRTNIAILILAGFGTSVAAAQIAIPIGDDPRSPIQNLMVTTPVGTSSLILKWSTPYDWDRNAPDHYEGRYSLNDPGDGVAQDWWDAAEPINGLPVPAPDGGTSQSCTVDGLLADETYYFVLRGVDVSGDVGAFSNPANGHTAIDDVAPGMPTSVQVSVTSSSSIAVSWINSGDDGAIGTASRIVICYSMDPNVAAPGWIAASTQYDISQPYPATLPQVAPISGLLSETVYYVRLLAYDDANLQSPATPAVSILTGIFIPELPDDGGGARCSAGATGFVLVAALAIYAIAASKASI